MSLHISKPSPETSAVIKNAFIFAEKSFHENDINRSILSKFLGNVGFELTDQQSYFLSTLLNQYKNSLVRKKNTTPKHLSGYRHACESLPIVVDLLFVLKHDGYQLTPLENELYCELLDLSQKEIHHVDYEASKYQEQYPQIQEALNNLADVGVLYFLHKADTAVCVELTPDCCC